MNDEWAQELGQVGWRELVDLASENLGRVDDSNMRFGAIIGRFAEQVKEAVASTEGLQDTERNEAFSERVMPALQELARAMEEEVPAFRESYRKAVTMSASLVLRSPDLVQDYAGWSQGVLEPTRGLKEGLGGLEESVSSLVASISDYPEGSTGMAEAKERAIHALQRLREQLVIAQRLAGEADAVMVKAIGTGTGR